MNNLIALEGELRLLKVMLFLQDILLNSARDVLLQNFLGFGIQWIRTKETGDDLHSTRICDFALSSMPDSY